MLVYKLTEFGFPDHEIYEDGTLVNLVTGLPRKISEDKGTVMLWDYNRKSGTHLSHNKLMGYYFYSPWSIKHAVPYKSLEPLGFSKFSVVETGKIWSHRLARYLGDYYTQNGYAHARLVNDFGIVESTLVHRLVALMFVPNPDPTIRIHVNHKDGIKANNHYTNLEWVTIQENNDHARKTGLATCGITEEQVHLVCKRLSNGDKAFIIADEMSLNRNVVWRIKQGVTHRSISCNYTLPPKRVVKRNQV